MNNNSMAVDVSIVIPVYNSESFLEQLVQRLFTVFNELEQTFEIIFVDDASSDSSWNKLSELQERYPQQIIAIQLMRNYGQHNALLCGFRHTHGKFILTMDDDGQHPPEEIPKLLLAIEDKNKHDLVYGVYDTKKHAGGRNLGSWIVILFFRFIFRSNINITSFRMMRSQLMQSILSYQLNYTYIDGLLAWNTQRVGQVVVEHHPRKNGASGYSLTKLVTLGLNLFTNFSILPLQMASIIGVIAAVTGFSTGGYYVFQSMLSNISVPGYASIIVAVLVLGGLQLLSLGLIGEYVGRLHLNINSKPQYTVRQTQTIDHEIVSGTSYQDINEVKTEVPHESVSLFLRGSKSA